MDASILCYGFLRGEPNARRLIDAGLLNPDTFEACSTPAEVFPLYRREHIDRLILGLPARRLHDVATDLSAQSVRGALEAMDEETFELYMRYHLTVCERGNLVGASHHVLDILQKQEEHAS